jgi:hypothetical protein
VLRLRKEGHHALRNHRGFPEIEAVHRFPNISLNFQEAYSVGEQLWMIGKVLQDDLRYAKPPNWVLTYRSAIRGMLARIITVDRDYQSLNEPGNGTATDEDMATQINRNWWNAVWESYAGTLFFAMDSSLECFAHAVNALGYLLSPSEFLDITADEKLRRITPSNLFDPPSNGNAGHSGYPGCLKWFPRICGHWSANRPLLAQIIEYHDATKHRHSVVVGQAWEGYAGVSRGHFLKQAPKQAMCNVVFTGSMVPPNQDYSLQSMAMAYRKFMIDWLGLTREELEARFGKVFEEV